MVYRYNSFSFGSRFGFASHVVHLGKNAHIVATKTQVEAATFNGLLDTLQNIIPSDQ